MKKSNLVFDAESFKGKKIKCVWCSNFKESVCAIKKIKIKGRKPRRCDFFDPHEDAIVAEINRGKDIETIKLSPLAYMTKSERKKFIKEQMELLERQASIPPEHPMTGNLDQFKTTADVENG